MVAQLVRALACHARGRGFEPHPSRHSQYASVAQLVEQRTENPRVVGSIPTGGTICGFSSFGRAPPCQGGGGGFEPRNPLQNKRTTLVVVLLFWSLLFGASLALREIASQVCLANLEEPEHSSVPCNHATEKDCPCGSPFVFGAYFTGLLSLCEILEQHYFKYFLISP